MKKRRLLYLGLNCAGVVISFGVIGALYFYVREDMTKFFIGLAIAAIGLIFFVSLFCAYNFADRELKQRWVSYVMIKRSEQVDYQEELIKTKNKYDQDSDNNKNIIPNPNVRGVKQLLDFEVLKTGNIGYGCVVEANVKLFSPSKFVHQVLPAVFAYSFDEHYQKNPFELKEIAKEFYSKEKNNILKDQTKMFTNYKISDNLTGGKQVFATVILVYRKHLPWGGFPSPNLVVPVIAAPEKSTSAFILDSKYWSDNLIYDFLKGVIPQYIQNDENPVSNDKVSEIFGELTNENKENN